MQGKFVSYTRCSTDRQGKSGLGLDAQRATVARYLGDDGRLLGEYIEVESGKKSDRPELAKALAHCRLTKATLIVAKLDRLARNARFLMEVYEGTGEAGVVFCDLPLVGPGPTGKFIVQQMAAVAELEAGLISERTKAALAQSTKKLGGWRGGPKGDPSKARAVRAAKKAEFLARVVPVAAGLRADGKSFVEIAAKLTDMGVETPLNRAWSPGAVRMMLKA